MSCLSIQVCIQNYVPKYIDRFVRLPLINQYKLQVISFIWDNPAGHFHWHMELWSLRGESRPEIHGWSLSPSSTLWLIYVSVVERGADVHQETEKEWCLNG